MRAKGPRFERTQPGFTLIEMVVTIVLLGIIAGVVTVFLQQPVQGYFDAVRRAQLVDTADFALRRIARDLATAVPNSIRSDASRNFLELLQTRSGGLYCNETDCGNPLLDGDNTFSVVGPAVSVAAGDSIVIGNLPNSGCDAYSGSTPNRRSLNYAGVPVALSSIDFSGSAFSGSCAQTTARFEIVVGPVSYACDSATATLWRYSGYTIQASQPASIATLDGLSGAVKAALATNVNCAGGGGNMGTNLDASAVGEGLVELRIQLQDSSGESVNLYRQVKVDNTP